MNYYRDFTVVALSCAALSAYITSAQTNAPGGKLPDYLIHAQAGTTFTALVPTEFDSNGNPIKFDHQVDGVVRVSSLGNCTVHFAVIASPSSPTSFDLSGTCRITTADGTTTLDSEVTGVGILDPGNPLFGDLHYDVKFTGGTGRFANARGQGVIDGIFRFDAPNEGGKATWELKGYVVTAPTLSITPNGTDAVVSWNNSGFLLQTADEPTGPWTDLPAGVAAQYQANVAASGLRKFFRLREE